VSASKRTLTEHVLHLRSPDSGTVGQGFRYAVVGGTVAVWYLAATMVLAEVVGLDFQIALVIGFLSAMLVHFTLQRIFVWVHHSEFALGLGSQVGRYLAVAGAGYAITAATTSTLPGVLDMPVTAVYLATAGVIAVANFLIFRSGVFHGDG
jgi:putative flippase GtrA